ncbi:DNA primase [Novosphingobium sp. KACC 22771]|uniref:DNA primase n=1 Tax=Novosphingobium sp. KACC 22771 TaxID=3025670 RepID=UPI0023665084|nr:DNA primase [Novosphingobium sp. KACC 22771]WDF71651.1 DNA primase [Novosphingobium sp. KACC 22771]
MSLSPQFLDELRSRITLSAIIGRTERVTKAGREFKACCPFHHEKTPSFTINDEKGFYHCFGCGAHGDVIRWMTDQRGLSFMDAVKQLAEEAGMEVPAPDPRQAQRAEKQKSLHDVMGAAQAFFVDQLASPEGGQARSYLASRGFSQAVCREFGFGYAPEGRQALKGALGQFPEAMLIEGGLRIVVEDKEPYDRFRGRLMLPIHDPRGRVIAFGGRILATHKTDAPKYLNSPDTPLFDKGRTLYNHHRASPASRQSGRIIVVEGYMDVIALAAAGFHDAVAPLGTALTETQIEMIWRMVPMPILCFDGDSAGQRAAMRAVTRALPLLRPGHSLRIVRMPQGQDPDELIKARGPGAMEEALAGAQSLLDTLWTHEVDAAPTNSPEEKAGLKARLMAHVDTIADNDIKALYRRDLLERFSAFAFPRREDNRAPWQPRAPRTQQRGGSFGRDIPPPLPHQETAQRLQRPANPFRAATIEAVLAGLTRMPGEIARHASLLARLANEDARCDVLLDALDDAAPLESADISTILASKGFTPPETTPRPGMGFSFLCESGDGARGQLADVLSLLVELPEIEAELAKTAQSGEVTDESWAEQQRLLVRLRDLKKRELDLKARLGQMAVAQDNAAAASPDAAHL